MVNNMNPQPAVSMNKAFAGGGATVLAGAITKIIVRIINVKWPGFLDPDTMDAVGVLITGAITFAAIYYTPHGNSN